MYINGADSNNTGLGNTNLKHLIVRPIVSGEENEWNSLMNRYHYLGFRKLSGRTLKYVALLNDQWVALIGWGSSVLKCTPRDRWIDWTEEHKYQRLQYIANNQRYLILPGASLKNLASRVLALNVKRLSADWEAVHGHPIVMVETFVDHSKFKGTCYRAAGWLPLGETSGYGRSGGKYYHHGKTKTVFIKPLCKDSAKVLSATFLPPELIGGPKPLVDLNSVSIAGNNGLLDYLRSLTDRRKKRGVRHSQVSILAVAICALLSGQKSFIAIGEWAASLEQGMLKRFGCKFNERLRQYVAPSEKTLRMTLKRVDGDEVDAAIGQWLHSQTNDHAVAVDGKTLRGSAGASGKPVHLLAAFLQHEKVVIGQKQVDKKSNEITAFRPLLEPLDIKNKVVTADAMHTQKKSVLFIVEEKNADYVFPVKQNQGRLFNTINSIEEEAFSPSVPNPGKGARSH